MEVPSAPEDLTASSSSALAALEAGPLEELVPRDDDFDLDDIDDNDPALIVGVTAYGTEGAAPPHALSGAAAGADDDERARARRRARRGERGGGGAEREVFLLRRRGSMVRSAVLAGPQRATTGSSDCI